MTAAFWLAIWREMCHLPVNSCRSRNYFLVTSKVEPK